MSISVAAIESTSSITTPSIRSKLWDMGCHMLLGSSIVFGIELNLFDTLHKHAYTPQQLAYELHIDERYTIEWCLHMYSNTIIQYNESTQQYTVDDDTYNCLCNEYSKQYVYGLIQFSYGCLQLHPLLLQQWKSTATINNGIQWDQLNSDITGGLRKWFNVNYQHLLQQEWIPCVDKSILDYIQHTGNPTYICDVGCGQGAATIQLARYFTTSNVIGYDYDINSIDIAAKLAKQYNINNLQYIQSNANNFQLSNDNKYDLIFFFSAMHDMSNPHDIIQHCKSVISSSGAIILIEPYGGNTLYDTCHHPSGALFAGVSLHYCTSCAKAYTTSTDSLVMGAIQPNSVYKQLWVDDGGFRSIELLQPNNTPANRIFQIRP